MPIKCSKEDVLSLFKIADFNVLAVHELANQYWPRVPAYYQFIVENPWFLIKTQYGFIKIGPRKKVISIDWEDTQWRGIITEDDVTKEQDLVHAWSIPDALKYLIDLRKQLHDNNF